MAGKTAERLSLSIIIASYNAGKTIVKCLESLRNQDTRVPFEIIVVDSSDDGTARLVSKEFPQVKLHKFTERKFCGDARNFGISVSKGEIVAFTDADCVASRKWADEILKAHQTSHLAIGGAIANGNPESYVGWAAYFCEFSPWMPGKHPGWLKDIPGANMSYKREVFERFGRFVEGTYGSDSEFHWRLGRSGYRLQFASSILVYHHNLDRLGIFLKHEFFHGRCFARVRVKSQNFSEPVRFFYVLFSFLIPLKLFCNRVSENLQNRVYLSRFLKSLPLSLPGLIAWSLGECLGYLKK